MRCTRLIPTLVLLLAFTASLDAREPDLILDVWTGRAPGETTDNTGETLPRRENESPPATRIKAITHPRLFRYDTPAGTANGTAVVLLPGGGYNYVVVDKEGSEIASRLNELGITAYVLHYRTKDGSNTPLWKHPVQDAQRAVSLLRANAKAWKLAPDRIGILGCSAGGQAAAITATAFASRHYPPQDAVDRVSCRPDFAVLVYPWKLLQPESETLLDEITIGPESPPTLLIHAHNDSATSLSSAYFYLGLKQHGVPAEMHVYQTGGHGYGMRPVEGAVVHTWPDRAADWLRVRGLVGEATR